MKHIKLYEGFKSDHDKLVKTYTDKIKDCILYLSDNYYTNIEFINFSDFVITITIRKNDDYDNLYQCIIDSNEKLKHELNSEFNDVTILSQESPSWILSSNRLLINQLEKYIRTNIKDIDDNEYYTIKLDLSLT